VLKREKKYINKQKEKEKGRKVFGNKLL